MLKTLILTLLVQTSTNQGDLMDYYNGVTKPTPEQARLIVNDQLKSPPDKYTEALSWYLSGVLHRKAGDNIKAAIDYHQSLELLRSGVDTTDYFLEISVRKNLGSLWDVYKHYDRAIELYEAALPFAEEYSKKEVASLYSNMGNSYRDRKDGKGTIESYMKALQISKSIDYTYKTAQVYNKLGLAFYHADRYDTAEHFFYQSTYLESSLQGSKLHVIGQAYHNIGQTRKDRNDLEGSIQYFTKALEYKSKPEDQYITLMDLGEVLLDNKDYSQAEAVLNKALTLFKPDQVDNEELFNIHRHLSRLAEERQDYQLSLAHTKTFASNLVEFNRKSKLIDDLESQAYFSQVVDAYGRDVRNKEIQKDLMWLVICLGVALLFIVIPFIVVIQTNRKIKQDQSDVEVMLRDVLNE